MSRGSGKAAATGTAPETAEPQAEAPQDLLAEFAGDRLFILSVGKCFHLLECMSAAQRALSLGELAQLSGLDKSAAQRLTHTLCKLGYLRQHAQTRAYQLSPRLLEFGHSVLQVDIVREIAEPFLQELNQACRETVNLMELEGRDIVYVLRYPSSHPVSVDLHVGSRLPAFCTAAGRAILANMSKDDVHAVLAGRRKAMTEHTVTDMAGLLALLETARREGFVINDQEAFIGDISLAVPLTDHDGEVRSAINIAVPFPRWTVERVRQELLPPLLQCARQISRKLAAVSGPRTHRN
ncbi:helix-turn-helix domain-containing protein [Xylophilus rhododendri]|uniref:Helix-turn-helix domain-containing protein n=1 Tax=Xylophilus rhododendri TaxID=2697032 RepID=A0A857JAB0_9BURK|nr:IclR family transcriptional regulator [Xylophilus rhododendri]QHJ00935.1 helix-turn-helix domain-containing protein [Xylophilus rhododendri]